MYEQTAKRRGPAQIVAVVLTVFTLFTVGCLGGELVEGVDANEVVVIQFPRGGMSVNTEPGWTGQWFGKVSRYQKRGKIDFQPPTADGGADGRLPIAFNDNGRAVIKGSMQYEMPLNEQQILLIHQSYRDQASLESGLIKPPISSSIFLTGQLMSSYESYKEKRSLLVEYVEDQTMNGKYRTVTLEREVDEEYLSDKGELVTRKKKMPDVQVVTNNGQRQRTEQGQLARFGIKVFGFAIDDIVYDPQVTAQINEQQKITMAVQTSMANARKAQQDAVTARATAEANVATARAQEEVGKTQAIVQAEKGREVARLKAEEAAHYKTEVLLRADADAEYKRRIMNADGALQQKLDAYKYGIDRLANALATGKQPLVPGVVIGGNGAATPNGLEQLMQLLVVEKIKLTPQ
jgi:hypothetical protein